MQITTTYTTDTDTQALLIDILRNHIEHDEEESLSNEDYIKLNKIVQLMHKTYQDIK